MKKTFILLLSLVLLFSVGCGSGKTSRTVDGSFVFDEQSLPKIAATEYTLDTAVGYVVAVLGVEPDKALSLITVCNTTDECYVKLINKECDIVLAHSFGSVAAAELSSTALKFTSTELKKDALVFLTNGKQNVSSLTLEQLKAVFEGEITDWSELNGDSLPITVFNEALGTAARGAFEKYVGAKMSTPDVTETVTVSGQKYSTTVNYDNRNGAIGYGLWSQTKHNKSIISLNVDGVEPADESIESGKYTLTVPVLLSIRASEASGSHTRVLYNWMVSPQGLKCIAFD